MEFTAPFTSQATGASYLVEANHLSPLEATLFQEDASMREQIRSIPPALQHGNRRDAPAVRNPKRKPSNAIKHGVFSIIPVMPGEDPREFEALRSAVRDEWQPSGPTEEDKVFAIAHAIWCKLRAQRFLRGKLLANTFDPRHPDFDEARGLFLFSDYLRSEPETAFANYASRHLRRNKIEHLKEKFPRSNYPSTAEWADAVITEIRTELVPAIINRKLEPGEEIDALSDLARQVGLDMRLTRSFAYSREFFEHELDQLERLDARISRLVKDLVQMKAMKQMLRQTSMERADEPPRKIAAPDNSQNSPRPIDPEKTS